MTTAMDGYVVIDQKGIPRIGERGMKVTQLVLEARANRWSPDDLKVQLPSLSLAQIHAALAYYYGHQDAMDAQIQRDLREVDAMRAASPPQVTRAELEE